VTKRLTVIKGPDKDKIFVLSDNFNLMFGRSKHAEDRLNDLSVSRVHCEVELLKSGKVLITDLESSGTYVNGKRISEALLKVGDIVRIGETEMRFEDDVKLPPLQPTAPRAIRPSLVTPDRLHELTGAKLCHYEVGPVLARAHSGLIFKATDFKHDRPVAFKVFWPDFSRDEDEMRRFVRAMKTTMPLRHPNLVTLYGAGKTGPYCWLAMELVEGESLTSIIARLGTAGMLDWKKALRVSVYLARALEYLHGQNVIHRNILPTNVLVGREPQDTKLGDLVLAKATEGALAQQITKPGEILGDVRYMAPERTRGGASAADGRSDLFSLGGLIYSLLTGKAPAEGKNLVETLQKIHNEVPVRPKKHQLGIPDAFDGLVMRLLSKKAEDRYQNATELLRELDKVGRLHGVPV
jgi:serine/threonine protein kinase